MVDHRPTHIVVMGVSGSGKSTVGEGLAHHLGLGFIDGDDLHPQANVAKMTSGTPLTDEDRWPWLRIVGQRLQQEPQGLVIACSALKRAYRQVILEQAPDAFFILLKGSRELLAQRLGDRPGHFMPPSLLDSQLDTLEPLEADEPGSVVEISGQPDEVLDDALTACATATVR